MPNRPPNMFRLHQVDIISSLIYICQNIYDEFSFEQHRKIREDIFRELPISQGFLLVLLEKDAVEVVSEVNVFLSSSEEQRHIKKLFNKRVPIILAVSVFDDFDLPQGDICIVEYARLLDRIGSTTITTNQNQKRLEKMIKNRRIAWRQTVRAATMDEFLDVLKKGV